MRCCFGSQLIGTLLVSVVMMNGCGSGSELPVKCYSLDRFSRMVSPTVSLFIMNTVSEGSNQIDIYAQIPYAKLRFEKSMTGFHASVSLSFILRNNNGEIIHSREMERSIDVETYEESISLRSEYVLERLRPEPGEYTVEVISQDLLSKLRYRAVEKIVARTIDASSASVSSMLFLNNIAREKNILSLQPLLPEFVSYARDSMGIFQEIYNVHRGDTISIVHSYEGVLPDSSDAERFTYWAPPYRMDNNWCRVDNLKQYARFDSVFTAAHDGTLQIIQFYPVPTTGFTAIRRDIVVASGERKDTSSVRQNVFRRDPEFRTAASLTEILSVMKYLLREKEYDSIRTAPLSKAYAMIELFWNEHGGKQKRSEFERKVMEANILFTSCMEGSKTPMGIVYVICGVPDYVECRGTLSENWYYAVGERTYVAQFRPVGDPGMAQMYELTPFSINESFWQYMIDRWRRK